MGKRTKQKEELVQMAEFELYQDQQNEYRWRLQADNGEIIADSGEGYVQKSEARNAIERVQQQAPGADINDKT